jgi:hypothetical protein
LRLFSIGKDRRLFEYDVYTSNMQKGLEVVRWFSVENEAYPTSCVWYPKVDSKEDLLMSAYNE